MTLTAQSNDVLHRVSAMVPQWNYVVPNLRFAATNETRPTEELGVLGRFLERTTPLRDRGPRCVRRNLLRELLKKVQLELTWSTSTYACTAKMAVSTREEVRPEAPTHKSLKQVRSLASPV